MSEHKPQQVTVKDLSDLVKEIGDIDQLQLSKRDKVFLRSKLIEAEQVINNPTNNAGLRIYNWLNDWWRGYNQNVVR